MTHRTGRLWVFISLMFLALATPVLAGGWAVVTLDARPDNPSTGKLLSLGFMVLQHGQTPIDNNPFEGGPLKPLLITTNKETGDKLEITARKEGPLGHFVVDVTFPTAGTWLLEIIPPPFAGTKFEPLVVQAAVAKPASVSQANVGNATDSTTQVASNAVPFQSWIADRWMFITAILVVGIGLMLVIRWATMRQHGVATPQQKGSG